MNLCVYVGVQLVAHLCPDSSAVGSAGIIFPIAGEFLARARKKKMGLSPNSFKRKEKHPNIFPNLALVHA